MTPKIFFFVGSILFCTVIGLPISDVDKVTTLINNEETIPSQASSLENELKQLHQAQEVTKLPSSENKNQINSESKTMNNISSNDYFSDPKSYNQEYKNFENSQDHIHVTEKTKVVLQTVYNAFLNTTMMTSETQPKLEKNSELVQSSITEGNGKPTILPEFLAEDVTETADNTLEDTEKREIDESRINIENSEHLMRKGEALINEELMEFMIKLAERPKLWSRVREIFDKSERAENALVWIENHSTATQKNKQNPKTEDNFSSDQKEVPYSAEKPDETINEEFTAENKKSPNQIASAAFENLKLHDSSEEEIQPPTTAVPDEQNSHELIPQVFTDTSPSNPISNQQPTIMSLSGVNNHLSEQSHDPDEKSLNMATDKNSDDIINDQKESSQSSNLLATPTSIPNEILFQVDAATTSPNEIQRDNKSDEKEETVEKELKAVANERYHVTSEIYKMKDDKFEDLQDVEEQLTALKKNMSMEKPSIYVGHNHNSNSRNM